MRFDPSGIDFSRAPRFQKDVRVLAEPARILGETVDTVLADGSLETTNVVKEGMVKITNPTGEVYLVAQEVFDQRYQATETEGVFRAVGVVAAVQNPLGAPITIRAEWGDQSGADDCMIARRVEDGCLEGAPYLIGAAEFGVTYRRV